MKSATWLLLTAVLHFASGCARPDWIEQTLVTEDVSGAWYGTGYTDRGGSIEVHLDLEQQGPKVKGSIRGIQHTTGGAVIFAGPIDGTVAGDVFSFRQTSGPSGGELTVGGDEMTGRAFFGAFRDARIVVRRVTPASRRDPPSP